MGESRRPGWRRIHNGLASSTDGVCWGSGLVYGGGGCLLCPEFYGWFPVIGRFPDFSTPSLPPRTEPVPCLWTGRPRAGSRKERANIHGLARPVSRQAHFSCCRLHLASNVVAKKKATSSVSPHLLKSCHSEIVLVYNNAPFLRCRCRLDGGP